MFTKFWQKESDEAPIKFELILIILKLHHCEITLHQENAINLFKQERLLLNLENIRHNGKSNN